MKALISILMALGCAYALHYVYTQFEDRNLASPELKFIELPVSEEDREIQKHSLEISDTTKSLEKTSLAPRLRQMIQTHGAPLNASYTSPDVEYAL